jgi:hypoxanthine phosphoribosyltransferase
MKPVDLTLKGLEPVPTPWNSDMLKGMMISSELIQKRVGELADEIDRSMPDDKPVVVLSLLSGAFLFTADLVRHWRFSIELDFMGVSSYGKNVASGELSWTQPMQIDLKEKHVLVIDDILDTGQTLRKVTDKLHLSQPASLRTCVLLRKERQQPSEHSVDADFVGFFIPDQFVVGYGLDFALQFRQLPFIGVLDAHAPHTAND